MIRRRRPQRGRMSRAIRLVPCLIWEWIADTRFRYGPLGDSPATVADGGWLLTDAGVRLVNETGIDGSTTPPPIVASGIAGAAGRKPFPAGMHPAGSDRATGVTEERPSRRETEGFVGVAPGIMRGAFAVRLLAPGESNWSAGAVPSGAAALRPRCDSGRDCRPRI